MLKAAYLFKKIKTSRVNNSRILRIKNANISGHLLFLYEHEHIGRFSSLH